MAEFELQMNTDRVDNARESPKAELPQAGKPTGPATTPRQVMRRLWLLPALVLSFAAVPYAAQDPGDPNPEATVDEVPLTDTTDGTVEPGWGVEIDTDTDLVGVRWDGDPDASFTVEARDGDGNWTPAVEAPPVDGGPDAGSPDAIHSESVLGDSLTTDPVWVGDATAVRVRLADGEANDVELIDVDSPEATYPEGSAGAVPPQPGIRSRASWGAAGPTCSLDTASSVDFAVVHHTVSSNTYSDGGAVVRGIQAFHQGGNGWCDIGYNFLVDRFGNIYEGRGGGITSATVGAHAAPFNTRATGVALIGNHSSVGVSSAAKTGLRNLLAWKLGYHGVNAAGYTSANGQTIRTLIAHRDVNQTECNGNVGYGIMPSLRSEVAFIIGLHAPKGKALEENPNGGWYGLDGTGTVTAVFAPHYGDPSFSWDIARDIAVMPDGKGYIVLDGFGGLHKFGSAAQGAMKDLWGPYWGGWDIARDVAITPDGKGLIVLDGWGGLHQRGTAPVVAGAYWVGWDIAKDVEIDDNFGVYILDGWGGVRARNGGGNFGADYWPGWDLAEDLTVKDNGSGYATLDAWGGIHPRGNMPGGSLGWQPVDQWRGLFYSEAGGWYLGMKSDNSGKKG